MSEVEDWKKLSIADKIEHKNWKARVDGYEEALKEMGLADSGKDAVWGVYSGLVKSMVGDSNAVAQEKALEVVLCFVREANAAPKVAGEICPGIVNKCFSSSRQKTRELGLEILKTVVEMERQDAVMDELMKGLGCKTPRVVVASVGALRECLRDFGPKIMPIKEILKSLPKLLEDRDKDIRQVGIELIIEIHRWVGKTPLAATLSKLKPVQVTELSAEFEKNVSSEKPSPSRYLRSQKPKEGAVVAKPSGGGDSPQQGSGMNGAAAEAIDPYDFIDPVEVISKIPNNYYEKIEEKKWTDRKEALEVIDNLTNHEKLIPGEYGDLMKSLLKVIAKDTNIVLVALSVKIVYQIAKGLRKKFSPYALNTIQICLERFKEKKANVVKSLRDCIDSAMTSVTLEQSLNVFIEAFNHKTPTVRSEAALFLSRVFYKSTPEILTLKLLKQLMPALTKLCLDSISEVRDASFQAVAVAMHVVSEKKMKPFLETMDQLKIIRIKEFHEKIKAGSLTNQTVAALVTQPQVKVPIQTVENMCKSVPLTKKLKMTCDMTEGTDIYERDVILKENRKRRSLQSPTCLMMGEYDMDKAVVQFQSDDSIMDGFRNVHDLESKEKNIEIENIADQDVIVSNFELSASVLPVKVAFEIATSEAHKVLESCKVPNQGSIDNYKQIQESQKKLDLTNSINSYLADNYIKRVISNIHNTELVICLYSSQRLLELIETNSSIILHYHPFILIVLLRQIKLIAQKLNDHVLDKKLTKQCLKNILFHLKQVFEEEDVSNKLDDELVVILMAVLLELSLCEALPEPIGDCIEDVAVMIYQKTSEQPFSDIVRLVALQITDKSIIQTNVFADTDLDTVIDKLFYEYIKCGDEKVSLDVNFEEFEMDILNLSVNSSLQK